MEQFKKDIQGTIYFLASTANQLIDMAEKEGLYPQGEFDDLRDEQKVLLAEVKENPNMEAWQRLMEINEILKNKPSKLADDLWDILSSIEKFIFKYYENSKE